MVHLTQSATHTAVLYTLYTHFHFFLCLRSYWNGHVWCYIIWSSLYAAIYMVHISHKVQHTQLYCTLCTLTSTSFSVSGPTGMGMFGAISSGAACMQQYTWYISHKVQHTQPYCTLCTLTSTSSSVSGPTGMGMFGAISSGSACMQQYTWYTSYTKCITHSCIVHSVHSLFPLSQVHMLEWVCLVVYILERSVCSNTHDTSYTQ